MPERDKRKSKSKSNSKDKDKKSRDIKIKKEDEQILEEITNPVTINEPIVERHFLIKKSYDGCIYCFCFMYKTTIILLKVSKIYLLWILLHYMASQLYIQFCVPRTFFGFFMSPLMTATPHCQSLRWVVYNAANVINNMWVILGTWICSNILIINRDNQANA
jgi:hypothetical protein